MEDNTVEIQKHFLAQVDHLVASYEGKVRSLSDVGLLGLSTDFWVLLYRLGRIRVHLEILVKAFDFFTVPVRMRRVE